MPEWYTAGQMPPSRDLSSFERDMAALQLQREAASENGGDPAHAPIPPPCLEHWDVVSGGECLADCSDTVSCLNQMLNPILLLNKLLRAVRDSHLVALSSQAKHWQGAKKASSSFVERFSCLTYPSVTNMEATSHPLPSRLCPSPAMCKFDSMQVISFLGFPGSMTGKPSTHMVGECRLH